MNQVCIIGRLTKDPELLHTNNNTAYTSLTVAIDRGKDKDGNDMGADFPRVIVWGKQAENCVKYIAKGRQIGVIGRIQTGSYEKDGVKRYTTDIVASRVKFLGSGNQQQQTQQDDIPEGFQAMADDEIPFLRGDDMVTLIIDGQLDGLNNYTKACRGNKFAGANMKKQNEEIISWYIKSQIPEVHFDDIVELNFRWYEPNKKRDLDNICFAKKFILDALVKNGTIKTDSWKGVKGFTDTFFTDSENPRIEVDIDWFDESLPF